MTHTPKYGTFEYVAGRGMVYKLNKPICFCDEKYRKLKFNPNVGIEVQVLMSYPPFHKIEGIRLKQTSSHE